MLQYHKYHCHHDVPHLGNTLWQRPCSAISEAQQRTILPHWDAGQGTGARCGAGAAMPLREAATLCATIPVLRMEELRDRSGLPVTGESLTKPGSLLQGGRGAWQPAR